jgi:hypothetical protein
MLTTYIDAPSFDDGQFLSAADHNVLRNNAMLLYRIVQRGRHAFCSSGVPRKTSARVNRDVLRIWWGSFQYRDGLDQAGFTIFIQAVGGSQTLKIYFDGVEVSSTAVSGTATYAPTVDLTTLGYTDRHVVSVEVKVVWVNNTITAASGQYLVKDAWVHGYEDVTTNTMGAFPTAPSWATVNAAKLNTLSNMEDWLAQRLADIPLPLFQGLKYMKFARGPAILPAWWGSVQRSNGVDRLTLTVEAAVYDLQLRYDLYINGSLIASSTPDWSSTTGQVFSYTFDIDISGYTAGTRLDLRLDGHPLSSNKAAPYTRVTLRGAHTYLSTHAALGLPPLLAPGDTCTYAVQKSRLGTLTTAVSTAAATISAAPITFDNAPMFSRRYVDTDGDEVGALDTNVASTTRAGDVLWVAGQGIKIGWGAIKLSDEPDEHGEWKYEFANTTDLIDGDKLETKRFYLNGFKGLLHGEPYYILGKTLVYAAEELR